MSSVISNQNVRSQPGTPTWEIARLYPPQGAWDEETYLDLKTNQLIEFKQGCLEFLPMPDVVHQSIVRFLFLELHQFSTAHGLGEVFFAPLRTRTIPEFIREPDVVFAGRQSITDRHAPVPGAQMVMEVVSEGPENRKRDLVEKRQEYAEAEIPEYWIIDPLNRTIMVLTLDGAIYREHGVYSDGDVATSVLLPGFQVDVERCFAAGDGN